MSLTPFQLRLIRDRLGITQPDAGQLIGASLGWVRHLEDGYPRGIDVARMHAYRAKRNEGDGDDNC